MSVDACLSYGFKRRALGLFKTRYEKMCFCFARCALIFEMYFHFWNVLSFLKCAFILSVDECSSYGLKWRALGLFKTEYEKRTFIFKMCFHFQSVLSFSKCALIWVWMHVFQNKPSFCQILCHNIFLFIKRRKVSHTHYLQLKYQVAKMRRHFWFVGSQWNHSKQNILKILERYLINSTTNPAHFHPNWAGLAVLFSR